MITRAIRSVDHLAKLIRRTSNAMLYFGMAMVVVIVVCSVYGVIMRALGTPVGWVLELTELLQVALAFLPAAYVLNADKHVSMELLNNYLKPTGRRVANALVSIIGIVVCSLMFYTTAQGAMSSLMMREATMIVSIPIYPFKFCVVTGYLLLTIQFAAHFWECVRGADWTMATVKLDDSMI